jgi:hypothetical protein
MTSRGFLILTWYGPGGASAGTLQLSQGVRLLEDARIAGPFCE